MANLTQSLLHARNNTRGSEDWIILRFDRDDRTLECYWSEPNAIYLQTSASANSSNGATRPMGGHAEMNMIRDFTIVLGNYVARTGNQPQLAQLFISRSPRSRSEMFIAGGFMYPIGCGKKLIRHAQLYYNIEWELIYDEVFRGNRANPVFDPGAHEMIALMNAEGNMTARRFNGFLD